MRPLNTCILEKGKCGLKIRVDIYVYDSTKQTSNLLHMSRWLCLFFCFGEDKVDISRSILVIKLSLNLKTLLITLMKIQRHF